MSKGINIIKKNKLKESIIKYPKLSLKDHYLNAGYSEATAGHHAGRMSVLKCVLEEISQEFRIDEVTIENVLKKISAGQNLALEKKDLSTYAFLVQLEGKYLAMFTDKTENKGAQQTIIIDNIGRLKVDKAVDNPLITDRENVNNSVL